MWSISSVYQPAIEGDLPRAQRTSKSSLDERRDEERRPKRRRRRDDEHPLEVDTFEHVAPADETA